MDLVNELGEDNLPTGPTGIVHLWPPAMHEIYTFENGTVLGSLAEAGVGVGAQLTSGLTDTILNTAANTAGLNYTSTIGPGISTTPQSVAAYRSGISQGAVRSYFGMQNNKREFSVTVASNSIKGIYAGVRHYNTNTEAGQRTLTQLQITPQGMVYSYR